MGEISKSTASGGSSQRSERSKVNEHKSHCFIATPFGKNKDETSLIQGWVDEVILPVVADLKLEPEIAALSHTPGSIPLEIRTHLAFDTLAIVDLGGATDDDPPNPNVMYELGIRHAFDLPTLVLAWDKQILPFDIKESRVIITRQRHAGTFKGHRKSLKEFGEAALAGNYFRPMYQVRVARNLNAAADLSQDAVLRALVAVLGDLTQRITSIERGMWVRPYTKKSGRYLIDYPFCTPVFSPSAEPPAGAKPTATEPTALNPSDAEALGEDSPEKKE